MYWEVEKYSVFCYAPSKFNDDKGKALWIPIFIKNKLDYEF